MAGATAEPLLLREGDHDKLVGLTRSSAGRAGLAARARIVLLAAEGTPNVEIARLVGVSRPTVNARRVRRPAAGTGAAMSSARSEAVGGSAGSYRDAARRRRAWV